MRLTDLAHQIVAETLRTGDVAVDATAGNGHDTVFLAKTLGNTGRVYSFDIQREALTATQQRLSAEAGDSAAAVTLIEACHSRMSAHVPASEHEKIACVMFNLGYLPGGDTIIVTRAGTTVAAIDDAVALLRPGGVISILAYPGHDGGKVETDAVKRLFTAYNDAELSWREYGETGNALKPPQLFVAQKAC